MILYYPTKFNFNTMNSFGVMSRGHFPSPPPPPQRPGTQKKPGPDRVKVTLGPKVGLTPYIPTRYIWLSLNPIDRENQNTV